MELLENFEQNIQFKSKRKRGKKTCNIHLFSLSDSLEQQRRFSTATDRSRSLEFHARELLVNFRTAITLYHLRTAIKCLTTRT